MPRLMRYDFPATVPPHLEAQIRPLLYAEWPGADDTDIAPALPGPELHPTYFVLAEGDRVLSYARTIRATVPHLGQSFKLYGLGDVVTRPGSRRKGYGGYVVGEATTHIKSDPEADAALLLTGPKLEPFYRRSGWDHVPGLRVATGGSDECAAAATTRMMLFLSPKACAARAIFPSETLVLPGDEW
jgi:predicted N-acetyltransferase YhbS